MALRRIEVLGPASQRDALQKIVRGRDPLELWSQCDEQNFELRALFEQTRIEAVLDALEAYMQVHEDIHVAVLDVKAALPRVSEREVARDPTRKTLRPRISREELSLEIGKGAELSAIYVFTVVLSTIVAAIGLLRNSPATVIGAMVIAPLMGPNMALALATTLGDAALARRALITSAIGIATAVLCAAAIGLCVRFDAELLAIPEIQARIHPHWSDVVLALASGTAGALAYTTGVSSSLVGVMVAVALLPPTVVATILAVHGAEQAINAGLLLATNIVGVILAGVATFAAQGLRPRTWWDAKRTKRATIWALSLLATLLALFTVLVGLRE